MLNNELPQPQRLALAYAHRSYRDSLAAALAFDTRLGLAVRQASEPIMAQMRLAWWRDQLERDVDRRARSDPLVATLDCFAGREAALLRLVDGWEQLLGERFDRQVVEGLVGGRAGVIALAVGSYGGSQSGRAWAYADLAAGLGDPGERELVLSLAREYLLSSGNCPGLPRPILILDTLGRRSIGRDGAPLLDDPASMLVAMRLGLLGR